MTCFSVSTHVSFSIYTLELETKSSVAVTSTFTLFLNAQLTFSPVSYPYCVLRCLLLSIQYPNVEEIYINVLVLFILKITKYFTKWSKLQHSIQQSTIDNQTRFNERSLLLYHYIYYIIIFFIIFYLFFYLFTTIWYYYQLYNK